MKQLLIPLIVAAGLLGPARADTPTSSGIAVENAWARATPGGARTGAVYLTLVESYSAMPIGWLASQRGWLIERSSMSRASRMAL